MPPLRRRRARRHNALGFVLLLVARWNQASQGDDMEDHDRGGAAASVTRRRVLAGLAGLGLGAAAGSLAEPAYAATGRTEIG